MATKRRKLINSLSLTIKNRNWADISGYLHEANVLGINNAYPLHEVCSDPSAPISVVMAIYDAYSDAANAEDNNQDTPIAIAVDVNFEAAVYFLANTFTRSSAVFDHSKLIISAINKLHPNTMIDSIINAHPEAAIVSDDKGHSAFSYFIENFNVFIRQIVSRSSMHDGFMEKHVGYGTWKVGDVYQKFYLFLNAASSFLQDKPADRSEFALNLFLKLEYCTFAFCKLIMMLQPEQVLQRDPEGNLPIHVILSSREACDQATFVCLDCLGLKSELVCSEDQNGIAEYCCTDCFYHDPMTLEEKEPFCMRPGACCNRLLKSIFNSFPSCN